MKLLAQLIRILGGIYFAIFLIATTAIFVAAGTILESITDSHRYASMFTYNSRLFTWLLWGFFINILISALRRWPFQKRHIPFLITHWGLLMILAGMLIKNAYGVQGSMSLIEGSGSDEIFIADSHALYIEERHPEGQTKIAHFRQFANGFPSYSLVSKDGDADDLNITLLNFSPHSHERLDTWIKGDRAVISGMPAFKLYPELIDNASFLTKLTPIILQDGGDPWHALAICCDDSAKTAEKVYIDSMALTLHDRLYGKTLFEGSLKTFLEGHIETPYGLAHGQLQLNYSPIAGLQNPHLSIELQRPACHEVITIALSGEEALIPKSDRLPPGKAALDIDLKGNPLLLFLQEPHHEVHLFAFADDGQISVETFSGDNLKSVIVYDQGYGGYAVPATIPFLTNTKGRIERIEAFRHLLAIELRQQIQDEKLLSPPFQLLQHCCQKLNKDIAKITIDYLTAWNDSGGWLADNSMNISPEVNEVLSDITWQTLPAEIYKGCLWNAYLFEKVDPLLKAGFSAHEAVAKLQWPDQFLQDRDALNPLETITLQIFAAAGQLPEPPLTLSPPTAGRLLSAYLRAYGLHPDQLLSSHAAMPIDAAIKLWIASHLFDSEVRQTLADTSQIKALTPKGPAHVRIEQAYRQLLNQLDQEPLPRPYTPQELYLAANYFAPLKGHDTPLCQSCETSPIKFECPLTTNQIPKQPSTKLENNIPCLRIRAQADGREQLLSLGFDRYGNRFKWPLLGGRYLVRFQPLGRPIPYRLRLRQARQINYAGSQQPYSYECDLLIKETVSGKEIEKTISMNDVHETWEGYRFYLSNVYPPNPGDIKRVQIVVNYDPAKYLLTYPGAIILTLGIVLLFWQRKERKRD